MTKTKKTNQELFDALMTGPALDEDSFESILGCDYDLIEGYRKQGLSDEEIKEKVKKDYQEAVENLDFSQKIKYNGRTCYPLSTVFEYGNAEYERMWADLFPRLKLEDVARSADNISDDRLEEVLSTSRFQKEAQNNPEAWGKIVKNLLPLHDHFEGIYPASFLRRAEDFMLHSSLVTNEEQRRLVKKIIATTKGINITTGMEQASLRDDRDYDFSINPKDLEYLATDLCPNTECLWLPYTQSYSDRRRWTNIADEHIQAISKFKKLKTLVIPDAKLTDKAFETLGQMKTLESLRFDFGLSEKQLEELSKLPHLKYISFPMINEDDREQSIRMRLDKDARKEKIAEVMHKLFPQMIPSDGVWIGPGHENYEEQKALLDKETKRFQELTGKNWKDKFQEALKKGDKKLAFEILQLNGLVDTGEEITRSYFGTDKDFKDPKMGMSPASWFETEGRMEKFDILDLGHNKIALGFIYDGSSWHRKSGEAAWGGGISYTRATQAVVIDLNKKEVVAKSPRSKSVQWRDRYDGSRDISITNMDNFLKKEGNKVVAWLENYGRELASTSVDIPQPKTTIRKTLTTGKAGTDASKVKAARDQKQGG